MWCRYYVFYWIHVSSGERQEIVAEVTWMETLTWVVERVVGFFSDFETLNLLPFSPLAENRRGLGIELS